MVSGEAPSWFTDVFSLCPHVGEGLGAPWGLCYESTDPIWGPHPHDLSPPKGPPLDTVTLGVGSQYMGLG